MQWACAESWIGVLKIIISSFLNSCGTDEKTMAKREATWTHLLSPRTCLSNTQFPTKSGWENKVFGSGKPRLQDVPSFHKWMDRSMRQMTIEANDIHQKMSCLGKWRKYTDSYTKATTHNDLLPTSHPDCRGAWGSKGCDLTKGSRRGRTKAVKFQRTCTYYVGEPGLDLAPVWYLPSGNLASEWKLRGPDATSRP